MLWTSIATGKRADQHGVLGFVEPHPEGKGIRPVSNTSRKVKALWNICTQQGIKSNVVGWWPSHPAEPIDGCMVSNRYQTATAAPGEPWPLPEGTVYPERLRETLAELRFHPGELTAEELLMFVPDAAKIDQEKDRRLATLAKIIADCTSVHAAATWLMEHEPWEFMAVYYDAIDHFSHAFMSFHPPRRPHVPEDMFEMYKDVVVSGYRYHDLMLGRLMQLAGPETTIVLVSDHGFHSRHLRPRSPSGFGRPGPAAWHRPLGIVAMRGPHIRKDERIYGACLLDVAPTVLTLLGLPVARDMEGRPLVQAFERDVAKRPRQHEIEWIDSWDSVPGECGMHPPGAHADPWEAQDVLQQLVNLGYLENPGDNAQQAIARATADRNFNLARVYTEKGKLDEAAALLEELLKEFPDEPNFTLRLAYCRYQLGQLSECRALVERLIQQTKVRRRAAWRKRQELIKQRAAALRAKQAGESEVADRGEPSDVIAAAEQLGEELALPAEAVLDETLDIPEDKLDPPPAVADYLLGCVCFGEGNHDQALEHLLRAEQAEPRLNHLHNQIGAVYLKQLRWADAERAFRKALAIDGESAVAHDGLAQAYLGQERYDEAADEALSAVGIIHQFPEAHYHLGLALAKGRRDGRARLAFRTCLSMRPGHQEAREWLERVKPITTPHEAARLVE